MARVVLTVAWMLAARAAVAQDSAAKAAPADTSRGVVTGALAGQITDQSGQPLAGVDIVVQGIAMRVKSRNDGSFSLQGIPAGDWEILFRKLGYDPADFTLNVVANTQLSVAVKLGRSAQQLDAVTISASVFNELGGKVLDTAGEPLAGAEVAIDGAGRTARTREDGAFLFLDVAPGRYLLRVRKLGYTPQQRGLEMVKQIERAITFRLASLAQALSAVEITARSGFSPKDSVARQEFASRRRMAGTQSDLLTSADLARSGRSPLSVAIRERALGMVKGGSGCVLIDGDQPMYDPGARVGSTATQSRRPSGLGGFGNRGGGTGTRLSSGESPAFTSWSPLQTIFADQVDAVEIYADNSENSRSACARFPISSPCTCAAQTPSVVVVWLKH